MSSLRWFAALAAAMAIVAVLASTSPAPVAQASGAYTFQKIATLGQAAPKGGQHLYSWEMGDLNDRGDVMSGSYLDVPWDWSEGVFQWRKGVETEIMRTGDPAPGGLTYGGYGYYCTGAMDNAGNVVFTFGTDPMDWSKPVGYGAIVSRYDLSTGRLSGVMIPNVTRAPDGGYFRGAMWMTDANNRGDTAFNGMVDTPYGPVQDPDTVGWGYGLGIYRATIGGRILSVASPGDEFPLGHVDCARTPSINDEGDVAFEAHHAEDGPSLCGDGTSIVCASSAVYYKRAADGRVTVVARAGDSAPGGGTYYTTWGASINNRGDTLFTAWMDTGRPFLETNLFLYRQGITSAVARAGEPMPGGGNVWNGPNGAYNYQINDGGDIAFALNLDEDTNGDGLHDSGEYVASPHGDVKVVARTGTVLPGIGTVAQVQDPLFGSDNYNNGFARINNRGQVLFEAILDTGDAVIVLATPR